MKRILICMAFVLLLAGAASAQAKSVTGTVVSYDSSWKTIDVKVGSESYIVFTVAAQRACNPCRPSDSYRAPAITGNVTDTGRRVRVYYSRIIPEHGFGPVLRGVTKIVEIKKSRK